MGWYTKPKDYKCDDCSNEYQFIMDTIFIATHGGLPIKCPNCNSTNKTELKEDSANTDI